MKYFKIFYGYGDKDYYSVEENELAIAMRAQMTQRVAVFRTATLAGRSILRIEPDFDKVEKDYNPRGEDPLPKKIEQDHYDFMRETDQQVALQIGGRTDNKMLE